MKRSRIKAIMLGLTLTSGSALAADPDWHVPGASKPTVGQPGILPSTLRYENWRPLPSVDPTPSWSPVQTPINLPSAVPVSPQTISAAPTQGNSVASVTGETPPASPPIPQVMPTRPAAVPDPNADTAPPPRPAAAEPLPKPRPSVTATPDTPLAQPSLTADYPVLPTAPTELLFPQGIPVTGRNQPLNSPPLHLSRDYPSLHELLFGTSQADERTADRYYVSAEYLLWWINPGKIPPLVTTSSNGGLGFLGESGTRTLLGPGTFGNSLNSGMRIRAGAWFDDCGDCGIDGSFFFLGRQGTTTTFNSNQYPSLTRPLYAPNFNSEFGEIVASPGFSAGSVKVDSTSGLWGADLNFRNTICRTCDYRAEWFAGFRYLNLSESVGITENITALAGAPDPAGTLVQVHDQFSTRNQFYGGQVGVATEKRWGAISLDVRASIALGDTHEDLDISGYQTRLFPGQTVAQQFNGGLLAVGPNLGHFSRDVFGVVPEVTVNLGYWLTQNLKIYAGYNFLYWSSVLRPGEQIDRVVDLSFVPNGPTMTYSGQLRPQPLFHESGFWAQGIQFGAMVRW